MPEVISLGLLVADVIARPVSGLPPSGRLALVDSLELALGGCAANTAVTLARFGAHVAVIGRVGRDGFGDFVVTALGREGVDVSGVRRDDERPTSASVVFVSPDGERSFLHAAGANASLSEADVDGDVVRGARVLHVGGALLLPGLDGEPMARILAHAQALEVTTSLDTVFDPTGRWIHAIGPALPYVDVLLASEAEASALTGESEPEAQAEFFLAKGVSVVAIKRGAAGSFVRNATESVSIPAVPVHVVDTTGAGDAFAAGVLVGILRGWNLDRTARFASAAGAACVRAVGATAGIQSLEDTESLAATAARKRQ
ncbi:MAG: sugar kinase [Planctomycetes bacterium]|nr:sugar kinase [Planctomycetota bacterium]MBI3846436.1 sugar kinase [Planctomycetota bacterium]